MQAGGCVLGHTAPRAQMAVQGSLLLNLVLLAQLERGPELLPVTDTFIRQCFSQFWANAQPRDSDSLRLIKGVFEHEYKAAAPEPMVSQLKSRAFPQVLSHMVKQHETACRNHVTTNLYHRVIKWWLRIVCDLLPPEVELHKHKEVKYAVLQLLWRGFSEGECDLPQLATDLIAQLARIDGLEPEMQQRVVASQSV